MSQFSFSKAIFPIVGIVGVIMFAYAVISSKEFPSIFGNLSIPSEIGTASMTSELNGISYELKEIRTPRGIIQAQNANNPTKRELGLSGRRSLVPGTGMIFIFPKPGNYGFWMKDMNFSIDIVWIRSDRTVIGIERNISPATFPKTLYPPSDIQFVLELKAGESEKFDIATGTILGF